MGLLSVRYFHCDCKALFSSRSLDRFVVDQLGRASFSIPLNIAEGSGKFSKPDRKNYFTTARASVFECVAVLDILCDEGKLSNEELADLM
jgi:four helix bundle protein